MTAEKFLAELGRVQREVDERWTAQKNEVVGALGDRITKGEFTDRIDSLKRHVDDGLASALAKLNELAASDPRNRVPIVPAREFSFYRSMAAEASTPDRAKLLFRDFMRSTTDNKNQGRFHYLASRLHILTFAARLKGARDWLPANAKTYEVRKMWHEYSDLSREFFGEDFYARAFDTTNQSVWIPDVLGADLLRYLEVRGSVLPNFFSFPLPAALWRLPITTGVGKARGFKERTSTTDTAPEYTKAVMWSGDSSPFDRRTFDVERMRAVIIATGEFQEESIIPIYDYMIGEAMDSIRRAAEDTFINGDETSPYIDADLASTVDTTGGCDNRILWHGLRSYIAANAATIAAGTVTHADVSDFVAARVMLDKYGLEPGDLLYICSVKSYLDLLDVEQFLTTDKIGERATVVTGQVGSVMGTPVVSSGYVRNDLAATGVNTTTTDDYTEMLLVHRPSWWIGNWRGITTEPERLAMYNQDVVYAWYAADIQKVRPNADKTECAIVGIK